MTAAVSPRSGRFASPIDAHAYGEQRLGVSPQEGGSAQRFRGRLGHDGFVAEPGRYHLYGGRFDPRTHRALLALNLAGQADSVSVSYVDVLRDGRGWAFRERTGADPVNGFTLLRQAYAATVSDYDGDVSIPLLWDRVTGRIVSDDADTIDVDLATGFGDEAELYPPAARGAIDQLNERIAALDVTITRAVYFVEAKEALRSQFRALDRQLGRSRYLLGDTLTLADLRLWALLVRYDVGPNATGAAGPRLSTFATLWAYARDLYTQPVFRATTDFAAFTTPLTPRPDWLQATERGLRFASERRTDRVHVVGDRRR